jgi:hypothetical protein
MTLTPLYAADKYTYRVLWSEEHQRYVGVCTEFPGLSCQAETPSAALAGISARVADELEGKWKAGEDPPVQIAIRRFKGQVR